MSYPTTNAFIYHGTWGETSRAHPAMKWMEWYTKDIIDKRAFSTPATEAGHTADWTLVKSTGETVSGADKAWKVLAEEVYAPFHSHCHDPQFLVCWATERGWDMFGIANLWWNLAVPGDSAKVKDKNGAEWDGVLPSAFYFKYVKEEAEIKLAHTQIFSDPSQALVQMLKRGMLKPEALMA